MADLFQNMSVSTRTYTSAGMQRALDLEIVRDQICGLLGQDCFAVYQLEGNDREHFIAYVEHLLADFDKWREKYE